MKDYAFGVDIGGTTIKLGLFETAGNLLEKWEIPTIITNNGKQIIPDIALAIENKLKERNIFASEIEGIGIGVPGPVLDDSIVNKCVNLGWGIVDVAEDLRRLTGIEKIKVGNDANVAALGEMWKGAGVGHKNVVMVTLGTGVGGGIVLNGQIVSGCHGAAGEIGHIKLNEHEEEKCGCGKKGHLEQYASATGIVRKAKELLKETNKNSVLRQINPLTSKDIFDSARKHDELALEVVEFACHQLGLAMAHIADVIDPEIFVIGGGVSKAGEILLEGVKKYYTEAVFHSCEHTEIALARCGNDAGMYGAVKMIL
jgi:glucokinase